MHRYKAESERLTEILAAVGVEPASLSSSGKASAETLAAAADMLGLKDTSTSSFYLGLERLSTDLYASEKVRKGRRGMGIIE